MTAGAVPVGVGLRVAAGEELLVLVTLRDPGEVLRLLLLLSSPSKLDLRECRGTWEKAGKRGGEVDGPLNE